jgi:hypothetical protein
MKIKYLDGSESCDPIMDAPLDIQQTHCAACLGLDHRRPETWPLLTIDKLLGIRMTRGPRAFWDEINRMNGGPPGPPSYRRL